jgi:hypothetical protein
MRWSVGMETGGLRRRRLRSAAGVAVRGAGRPDEGEDGVRDVWGVVDAVGDGARSMDSAITHNCK